VVACSLLAIGSGAGEMHNNYQQRNAGNFQTISFTELRENNQSEEITV